MIDISFVVPIFNNSPQELYRCIKSIKKSTDCNYEIIIINDGSNEKYKRQYKNICKNMDAKLFSQPNKGPGAARNYGVSVANGKYLFFVDSDDLLKEKKLRKANINQNADFIIFNIEKRVNKKSKIVTLKNVGNYPNSKKLVPLLLYDGLLNWVWAKLYSVNFLRKNNIKFSQTMHTGEDIDFIDKVLKFNPRIQYVYQTVYTYLYNNKTTVNRIIDDPIRCINDNNILLNMRCNLLNDMTFENKNKEKAKILNNYIKNIFSAFSLVIENCNDEGMRYYPYFYRTLKNYKDYKLSYLTHLKINFLLNKHFKTIILYSKIKQYIKIIYR